MARWEPGAETRLQKAAVELFAEQGFEQTTVSQIANRAGLTTRTFFRYFADKREVLFGGEEQLPPMATKAITDAPAELSPLQVIEEAIRTLGGLLFEGRRAADVRRRRAVIAADPNLRERELRKLADLRDAISDGFRARGLDEVSAVLAAETAVTVFSVAVRRWLGDDGGLATDNDAAADARSRDDTGRPGNDTGPGDNTGPGDDGSISRTAVDTPAAELPAIASDTLRRLRELR